MPRSPNSSLNQPNALNGSNGAPFTAGLMLVVSPISCPYAWKTCFFRLKTPRLMPVGNSPEPLPEGIWKRLPREKLQRLDRKWELTLLTEAIHLKWTLTCLEVSIPIEKAQDFHTELQHRFWPDLIVLFVESMKSGLDHSTKSPMGWRGVWYLLMPRFGTDWLRISRPLRALNVGFYFLPNRRRVD